MPRREERERQARERAAMQAALDREARGALTPTARIRFFSDSLICECQGLYVKDYCPGCDHDRSSSCEMNVKRAPPDRPMLDNVVP
jgi:hypothetical protein